MFPRILKRSLEFLVELLAYTTADFVFHKFHRLVSHIKTFWPLLEKAADRTLRTIVVNHGIPWQAVKPSDGTFLIAKRRFLLHATNESRLQDVFRCSTRIDAGFNEPQELVAAVKSSVTALRAMRKSVFTVTRSSKDAA
jgi:hypothetical protein